MKRTYSANVVLMASVFLIVGYGAASAARLSSDANQTGQGTTMAASSDGENMFYLFHYLPVRPRHPNQYPLRINGDAVNRFRSGSRFILQAYPFGPPLSVLVESASVFNGIRRFTGDISSAELQHIGSFSITISADGRDTLGNISINHDDYDFSTRNGQGVMRVINPDRQPVERCYPNRYHVLVCS
ncbi:hypothetical protein ABK905_00405 [Acerihabitans sp. KWT182]|uniref:Uncharacterized protein n=1 Tax=Acerihabitans sp. KWT182 TaxID=3157919 RepID=A0AAU7QAE0_9GAMM